MKSSFYILLLGLGLISGAGAQSLYLLASPVGLEESVPLTYRANVSFGYDDNVNAVPSSSRNHQESGFARIRVRANASNWDAKTQYSFDVQVGGIFYFESMSFGSNDVMSDSTGTFSLVHNISPTVRYTASATISYMPEPDYTTGINVGSRAGEYFYAYFGNSISKAWTERLSTTTGFNLSMLYYSDSVSKIDNRDYYRLNHSFRYKWTARSAVSLAWNGEFADRRFGTDATSNFVMAGWEYALTQNTNISLSAGPQFKYTSNTGTEVYAYGTAALNHKVTNRTNISFFFRCENEATNTYQSGRNYGSNQTYRFGVTGSHALNHVLTLYASVNYLDSAYRKPQPGLDNRDVSTWNFSCSLNYDVTKNLALRLGYSYTHGDNSFVSYSSKYDRNIYSISAIYTF